jgi:hypothetical protein
MLNIIFKSFFFSFRAFVLTTILTYVIPGPSERPLSEPEALSPTAFSSASTGQKAIPFRIATANREKNRFFWRRHPTIFGKKSCLFS